MYVVGSECTSGTHVLRIIDVDALITGSVISTTGRDSMWLFRFFMLLSLVDRNLSLHTSFLLSSLYFKFWS
jgi:hypothetical protein